MSTPSYLRDASMTHVEENKRLCRSLLVTLAKVVGVKRSGCISARFNPGTTAIKGVKSPQCALKNEVERL